MSKNIKNNSAVARAPKGARNKMRNGQPRLFAPQKAQSTKRVNKKTKDCVYRLAPVLRNVFNNGSKSPLKKNIKIKNIINAQKTASSKGSHAERVLTFSQF